MREITYCEAINEAMTQEMARDPGVFTFGIGVPDHKTIFGSVDGLLDKFGAARCFDTPVCEDTMTGIALGAAVNGMRPIHVHIRVDFLLLAMNQLANMVSTYTYATGGKVAVPLVIRAIVGRGWGQGFQHSKSLHSTFAHIPGLKVISPTTPYDAKGMLSSAIRDNSPVIVLEHRWLYWQKGHVPEQSYQVPLGEGQVLRDGTDLSIIATSWMNVEALVAAKFIEKTYGLSIEIIDPRSIAPLDEAILQQSVSKTGRCIIADNDWSYCGLSAELAASIYKSCFSELKCPIERIGFAHTPCPTVRFMEDEFYPNAITLIRKIEQMFQLGEADLDRETFYSHENKFKGPF